MKKVYYIFLIILLSVFHTVYGQTFMTNIPARNQTSLNGKWQVIIDPVDFGKGSWTAIYKDKSPTGKTDFYEYSFNNGPVFDVPGDFNSQLPELKFYESTVWYKKIVEMQKKGIVYRV